ncbi:MalY/PatB family protein [uncultured Muribaculum sp.]|uniref:MalY/PatB family protein n=1 Tax=uncultured Muribaculum sp. TaxID=1918613 RepID=UPI0025EC5A69|nr:MalY/PatB family protein [uncultured Muribaculum sp.]
MTSDFDKIIERRHTESYKWDTPDRADVLPMWVADMDFRTAPVIIDALRRRVDHGVFGYTHVPDEYYRSVIDWFEKRHGWKIDRSWFIYTSGVVPAISAIIKALTVPGDKVIVTTPVYNCFFSSIRNNGCVATCIPLVQVDGRYEIDFAALETAAADPSAKVMLLCNPHNPGGRVWTHDELIHLADICLRHGVYVVSDEIHCELTYIDGGYTPFGSLPAPYRDNASVCVSPSKAFNIAGLQIANIITPDAEIRRRIDRAININEVCDVNPFGVEATIAAYRHGGEWLESLVEYIHGNYTTIRDFIAKELPALKMMPLESTYLAWIDIRATRMASEELTALLLEREKLMVNPGTMYGADGEGFVRINFACPRSVVIDALNRFKTVLTPIL